MIIDSVSHGMGFHQAMAFLSKYRNLRGENAEGMREVEYNFGRIFHQLGQGFFIYIFIITFSSKALLRAIFLCCETL